MKTVHHVRTLVYYDGPVVFEARDDSFRPFVGMAVTTPLDEDAFVVVPVTPDRLHDFRRGRLELLSLLTTREERTWYLGDRFDESGAMVLSEQEIAIEASAYLPEAGFVLHPVSDEDPVGALGAAGATG